MEYLTSDELSKLWGISPRQVRKYCMKGLLEGAFKDGSTWKIPSDVKRPKDGRVKSGKYFDWRMKYGRKVEREITEPLLEPHCEPHCEPHYVNEPHYEPLLEPHCEPLLEPHCEPLLEPLLEPKKLSNDSILDRLKKEINMDPTITKVQLAKNLNVSLSTIKRVLKDSNIIFIGSSRTGHWVINEDEPNEQTYKALQEVENISNDPNIKGVDVETALKELKK